MPSSPIESPSPTHRSSVDPERLGVAGAAVGRDDEADPVVPARPGDVESRSGRDVAVGQDQGDHAAMLPRRSIPPGRPDARLRPVPDAPVHPSIQRVLDAAARKGVTLEVTVFDESTHTAVEAAAALGVELGQIVKSLVFVVPGERRDRAAAVPRGRSQPGRSGRLAAVTSAADVRRATAREAHELTGFAIGGIPPIGHLRPVRVIMDPDLGRYQVVWAAAGLSTAVFAVPPGDAADPRRTRRSPRSPRSRPLWPRLRRRSPPGRTPAPDRSGIRR